MVIVDLETTNLIPYTGSIISIAGLDFDNPENTFYGECRVSPDVEIDPKSLEINGFTIDQIKDSRKPNVKDLISSFIFWLTGIKDQTIAGQNVHWDTEYLRIQLKKYGFGDIRIGHRIVDLHSICFAKMMELNHHIPLRNNRTDVNLDTILAFCGLKPRLGTHNALEDCKLEAECFSRIIFGKSLLNIYADFDIPKYLLKGN